MLFSRYLVFCFDKSTNFKICDVIIGILANRSYAFDCFFKILGSIKIKFGQIIVKRTAIISNLLYYEE